MHVPAEGVYYARLNEKRTENMTDWTSWVLASSVLLALYDIAKKASVSANAVLPVLLASTSFGFAAYSAGLFAAGRFCALDEITGVMLLLGLAKSVIVGTSWVFTFCALRTLPITIATPILSWLYTPLHPYEVIGGCNPADQTLGFASMLVLGIVAGVFVTSLVKGDAYRKK